jgi:hypothetical protein
VLASAPPPFYDSGIFWAIVAVVVAIAANVITVVLWHAGDPRRLVTYGTPAVWPFREGSRWPGLSDASLQVLQDGKPLADPYVSILRVENRSRRDIIRDNFDGGEPLWFDLGAEISSVADAGSSIDWWRTRQCKETAIGMGPMLMRAGASLQAAIITEGPPHITCDKNPLSPVRMREEISRDVTRRWAFRVMVIAAAVYGICFIAGVIIATAGHAPLGITLLVLSALVFAFLVSLGRRGRPDR